MKKAFKIVLIISVLCLLLLSISVCLKISVRRKVEREYRIIKLEHWQTQIADYLNDGHSLPVDLYQYCKSADNIPYTKIAMESEYENRHALLNDPNLFQKEVLYELKKQDEYWYVIEKCRGKHFRERMKIDKKGTICVIDKAP